MKESADFVTHVTSGQQRCHHRNGTNSRCEPAHTHRQKHAVEAETGWLGNTKETVKKKQPSLLISQKSIVHTACFLCSLARAGLWWNRTGNCVMSVLHRRVVGAMVKQNLEDKNQDVRLICEDVSPISALAAVAGDQVSLKEKYKCSMRNDAERAGNWGCPTIAGTHANTDHCSLGSVPAEFSVPSKTPSS